MVKKSLLIFLLALGVLMVNGQSKLSPYTLSYLRNHSVERTVQSTKITKNKLFTKAVDMHGTAMVSAFVKLTDGASTDALSDVGVIVNARFGNTLTVQVPVDSIVALSELATVRKVDVAKPYRLKNDKARSASKVDLVHAGTGFTQAFTGEGVVYGTVDTGIDVNHIAFSDAEGKSRVKRVYWPSGKGTPPTGVGTDGNKFPGAEYTTPEAIAKLTSDSKSESHGSHTAGIGAGGYMGNGYYGMAPNADLVLCGTEELTDVNIANGVLYAFNYAKSVNKPAVVNLSLGGHVGAHDGTSEFTQVLDNMADEGKIIVMSAGNEGGDNLYINKTFSSSTDQLKSFVRPFEPKDGVLFGNIDAWSRTKAPIGIQVVIYNKSTKKLVYESKVITNNGFEINDSNDKAFAKYFSGYFSVYADVETGTNGKYNCWSEYELEYVSSTGANQYYLGVIYTGAAGTQMDAWIDDYYTYFGSENQSGWLNGNATCSISDMATGKETISVGAYSSRDRYTDLKGREQGYGGLTLNQIAPFSSYGVDMSGVARPDVTGPGFFVLSAVNSYDPNLVGSANHDYLATEITANGRKHQWADMAGTSMSSPAVAGIIALWLQADPTLDAARIKTILKNTSVKDSYVNGGNPVKWGAGKIDANAGLIEVLKGSSVEGAVIDKNAVILYPNPSDGHFTLYAQGEIGSIRLNIYNSNGSLVIAKTLDASEGAINVDVEGELSAGLYIVQVIGEKTNFSSRLIIK